MPTCAVGGIGCVESELRDTIQVWRDLAMEWRLIAAALLDPEDGRDVERYTWASSEGWDALVERTDMALAQMRERSDD